MDQRDYALTIRLIRALQTVQEGDPRSQEQIAADLRGSVGIAPTGKMAQVTVSLTGMIPLTAVAREIADAPTLTGMIPLTAVAQQIADQPTPIMVLTHVAKRPARTARKRSRR